jgi:hypothetical protein
MKVRQIILCGDWNINFLQENVKLNELKNLLNDYNLVNAVDHPTRITNNTKSMIDVIIINNSNYTKPSIVMNLGFSDHYAQILSICTKCSMNTPLKVMKTTFDEGSVKELHYNNLNKESWKEVLLEPDVNGKFDVFKFFPHYHFDRYFPLKFVNQSRLQKKSWITQGIKKSSVRLR